MEPRAQLVVVSLLQGQGEIDETVSPHRLVDQSHPYPVNVNGNQIVEAHHPYAVVPNAKLETTEPEIEIAPSTASSYNMAKGIKGQRSEKHTTT